MDKKMSSIAIITIFNSNYGNRLQNYALQEYLKNLGCQVTTIKNIALLNNKKNNLEYFFRYVKSIFKPYDFIDTKSRELNFKKFNNFINFTKKNFNWYNVSFLNGFDFLVVGSDQVWNPNFGRLSDFDLANFKNINSRVFSYAASIGISNLNKLHLSRLKDNLYRFNYVSLREEVGKKILENSSFNKDIFVHIDPTMLLSADEWDKVSLKPKMLKKEKFILNYFLGELSEEKNREIERIAKENNCEIINILDKNSPFYECGPSEFLWLEKNAFLICTDSFHSSVFAILYNRPFVIFDREQEGVVSMNSRLDTLISKFNLKNRKFEGKITEENLNHDYSEAYKILEVERQKSKDFLERALDIKK